MSELEEIRTVLREYFALESEYKPIADGWSNLRLRGAARKAWLKKTRVRLSELRARLTAFAAVEDKP